MTQQSPNSLEYYSDGTANTSVLSSTKKVIDYDTEYLQPLTSINTLPELIQWTHSIDNSSVTILGEEVTIKNLSEKVKKIQSSLDNGEKISPKEINEGFGKLPGLKDVLTKVIEGYAIDKEITKRMEGATKVSDLIALFAEAENMQHSPFGSRASLSGIINSLRELDNNINTQGLPSIDDQISIYDVCQTIPGLNGSITKILENKGLINNT